MPDRHFGNAKSDPYSWFWEHSGNLSCYAGNTVMPTPIDLSRLHPMARKALEATAPKKLRLGAARGLLPGIPPADILTVVALLSQEADSPVSTTARTTLAQFPPAILDAALNTELAGVVIEALARSNPGQDSLLTRLLDNAGIAPETVAFLAEHGSESLCEHIAINEQRALHHPIIIEKLYMNEKARSSTAERLLDLAVRNGVELNIPAFKEAAAAIQNELIIERSEEPTPDDILFRQVGELAEQSGIDSETEDVVEIDDEGNEVIKPQAQPLWVQIGNMTVSQKIRRALLGTGTERMLLVRDTNRLVAAAAIRSPKVKENEVAQISSSRAVSDEVLRIIATNQEWTHNHQIKYNLVCNPRTPFTFAAQLVPHLREHELKSLAKSKNVTGAVAQAARQHLMKKQRRG